MCTGGGSEGSTFRWTSLSSWACEALTCYLWTRLEYIVQVSSRDMRLSSGRPWLYVIHLVLLWAIHLGTDYIIFASSFLLLVFMFVGPYALFLSHFLVTSHACLETCFELFVGRTVPNFHS